MAEILKVNSFEDAMNDNFEVVQVEETKPEIIPEPTPEQTQPPVEEPKPEENQTLPPAAEETKPDPIIQEKIVEKIVEKYPELDENAQQILAALQEGKEDVIYGYLQEKFKDYDRMSDVDVVKEKLRKEFPHYNEKNIDAKFKSEYGRSLEPIDLDSIDETLNPDEYKEAVKHNQAVEEKLDLLEVSASDARKWLNEQKKNVVLPKITSTEAPKPTDAPSQEEIDAYRKQWEAHVESEVPKLSELKFKVGDEEVSYKVTDEERKEQVQYMKTFDGVAMAKELGWVDDNGVENVLKIAEDRFKLKNIDKIIASAITHAKPAITKEVIARDIKNIPIEGKSTPAGVVTKSFAETALDA